MNSIFFIFNPKNLLYLLINKPIANTRVIENLNYIGKKIIIGLILFVILFLMLISMDLHPTDIISTGLGGIIFLMLLVQLLNLLATITKSHRVYLTENSFVLTYCYIKFIEVKFADLFAVDVDRDGKKNILRVFVIDKNLGNTIGEKLVSDTKMGFYIEATDEFVEAIKDTVPEKYLSPDIKDFPKIKKEYNLNNLILKYIMKINEGREGKQLILVLFVLFLHPLAIWLYVNFVLNSFIFTTLIVAALMPLIDKAREKVGNLYSQDIDEVLLDGNIGVMQKIEFLMQNLSINNASEDSTPPKQS